MRTLTIWGLALAVAMPTTARAGSTIELVPPAKKRSSEPEPPPSKSKAESKSKPKSEDDAPPPRPTPASESPPPPLDLTPKPPPAALDRVPAELEARRRGPPVMPWIGVGVSVAAGIAGAVFLAEAARNLDAGNYTLVVEGEGDDLEVDLSDDFIDAQNAVIGNGIAGAILVSSASAGLLASILALTTRR